MCSLGQMAMLCRQSWGWAPVWLSWQLLTPIQWITVNNNHPFSLLGPDTSTESAAQQFRRHVDIFTPLHSRSSRNSRPNSGSLCAKKNVLGDINVKKWRKNDKAVSRGQFGTDAHPRNLSVNVVLGNEWERKRKQMELQCDVAGMRKSWNDCVIAQ